MAKPFVFCNWNSEQSTLAPSSQKWYLCTELYQSIFALNSILFHYALFEFLVRFSKAFAASKTTISDLCLRQDSIKSQLVYPWFFSSTMTCAAILIKWHRAKGLFSCVLISFETIFETASPSDFFLMRYKNPKAWYWTIMSSEATASMASLDHLFTTSKPPLNWPKKFKVAMHFMD